MVLYDFVSSVVLESGNKEDTGFVPLKEEIEINIATIHGNNAAEWQSETAGGDDIYTLAIGNHGEGREKAVMVQKQVELNGAFGLTEICPRKQAGTKVDDSRVDAEQLVLEAELSLLARTLLAANVQQLKKGILAKLPWPVGIGIAGDSQLPFYFGGDPLLLLSLKSYLGQAVISRSSPVADITTRSPGFG